MRPESPPATDRILFASASAQVGAFRCRPDHPSFADTGPIQAHIVVFPRTSVEIHHEGSRPFVADACVATLYNRGQRYRRAALDPAGDRCDWFALAPQLALEVAAHHDPAVGERPDEPYRFEFAPVTSALYLRQRRLFDRLSRARLDALEVEEELLGIVECALAGAYRQRGGRRRRAEAPRRGDSLELAERAAALLGRDLDRPLALAALAASLGVTAPHLCRTFRRARASTLHAHRTELRLRSALELLGGPTRPRRDLTEIALACGFSSHSHFTSAFRRRFGLAPSRARAL
jgi:AraC family transcriptional regulator